MYGTIDVRAQPDRNEVDIKYILSPVYFDYTPIYK